MKLFMIFSVFICISASLGCIGNSDYTGESTVVNTNEKVVVEEKEEEILKNGTYQNPAQIREPVVLKSLYGYGVIGVSIVIRGPYANELAYTANQFNREPSFGYEYAFVFVSYMVPETEKQAVTVSSFQYKAFSNGVECDSPIIVMPKHLMEFSTGTVLPGGFKSGWIPFIVPENEVVLVSYAPLGTPECYISIGDYQTDGTNGG
ncbi:MAG TPA: hypothetical protein C5S51_10570 [Methanosarcinaceae archaeon]|nr:hypothetical protein [Methanosarcinaceae archaeon]